VRPKFNPALGQVLAVCLVLAPASWCEAKYKVLHSFTGGLDGGLVATTPALDGSGNLYGTTAWGGTSKDCEDYCCGVAYELTPKGDGEWKESVLFNFGEATGGAIRQPLLFDSKENLFGATVASIKVGGPAYIFELTPREGQWNFDPIYDQGGYCLVFDQAGDLYGCIGPGVIGELSPSSSGWTYTALYDGCGGPCRDGNIPEAPLSWDGHGNLYGTMLFGGNVPPKCHGSAGCGVAFRMTPKGDGTWTYNVLHRFAASKTDGYYPYAGLTVDAAGNAYGVTSAGGKYGTGTFFKLTPTKSGPWKETILYEFPNCNEGCVPAFTLVADKAGNICGSAAGGLDCEGIGCGVVFKLAPQKNGAWKYSVVHKLNGNDGAFPYGVVLDDKGDIFGTTMQGGKYNLGVAFEITP